MNENYEFLSYQEACEDEKYFGIATVKLYGKIISRFKMVKTKDGGYFPASPSYKIREFDGERFIPSFFVDSHSENEVLMNFIRKKVSEFMTQKELDCVMKGDK